MKPKWLFEKDIFEDNTNKMIEEVKFQEMEAEVVPYIPFDEDIAVRCAGMFDKEDCVIFYGSLNFGKKLRKLSWYPGVYLNEKAFECTSYYPAITDLLLHYNSFIMLPYGVLKEKKKMIFDLLGPGPIFIRPNSGTKEFTGFVTNSYKYEEHIELAGFYDVEPDLLVLVSKAMDIIREWRFVIVDGKVISGSLYRYWGELADDKSSSDYVRSHSSSMHKELHEVAAWRNDNENKAWEVAQECAERYNPDRAWTIDVCETRDEKIKVLEIGCFSCAGMYKNNLRRVISAVSKAALDEWKEIYE